MEIFLAIICFLLIKPYCNWCYRDLPWQKKMKILREQRDAGIITMNEWLEETTDISYLNSVGGAKMLRDRNMEIINMSKSGMSVEKISEVKSLTEGKIKRIISGK